MGARLKPVIYQTGDPLDHLVRWRAQATLIELNTASLGRPGGERGKAIRTSPAAAQTQSRFGNRYDRYLRCDCEWSGLGQTNLQTVQEAAEALRPRLKR